MTNDIKICKICMHAHNTCRHNEQTMNMDNDCLTIRGRERSLGNDHLKQALTDKRSHGVA